MNTSNEKKSVILREHLQVFFQSIIIKTLIIFAQKNKYFVFYHTVNVNLNVQDTERLINIDLFNY